MLPESASVTKLEASLPPPTPDQLMWAINEVSVDTALWLYDKFRDQFAQPPFPERTINALGYRSLQQGNPEEALLLFKLNTEVYPGSANVWDSYAEACETMNDIPEAIRAWNKVLEVAPNDTAIPDEFRNSLTTRATEHLETLTATEEGESN
jgi:tetratricopeptide (TPR) repeat protein